MNFWAHSMGPQRYPLSRVVVVVVVVVDIDAQAACNATVATPGEWQCGVQRLAVANGPNIFQMLLVFINITILCFTLLVKRCVVSVFSKELLDLCECKLGFGLKLSLFGEEVFVS